ncbi:stimulated by retinoic acid gene 8 protein homolog [Electrophorus electricus]|uniref:stimulated by retinoic acid gene 8 protein homolog n=1 Tax=Electrophorus electricus TaxID=8005 RepID=UPI0015CFD9AF|nr:stimulated by retinoic acid gene 8 protein homolog [Electrophorus electricus]
MFSSREKKRDANEHRKARRRAVTLQSHHRATLAGLFESLKNVVCPTTQKTPAKWKILDHAKGFLLEKEAYLSKLLALKEVVLNDNEGPKTLEEVREEYRKLYSKCYRAHVPHVDEGSDSSEDNEEMDESPQSTGLSVPNFQEFEGYLCFYRQTLELLLHSRVLASYQTSLPVVSQAISGLWNILPPEQKTAVQRHTLDEGSVPRARPADKPSFSPVDSSQLASVNTYGTSAFEADLLQDVYDVVQRDMDATSANRSALLPLQSDDYKRLREIYKDIKGFVQSHTSQEEELSQDWYPGVENEELFLRCSESFDEDF